MKKMMIFGLVCMMIVGITACGSKPAQSEAVLEETSDRIGSRYMNAFDSATGSTPAEIVDELIAANIFESELVPMDVEEGYLDGFSDEIRGFKTGVKFSPMIGSIPFVGYVFEAENPEELAEQLNELADPNWNICTFADETVMTVRDNLVFFMMCSNE